MKITLYYTKLKEIPYYHAIAKDEDDEIIWVSKYSIESDDPVMDLDLEDWSEEFLQYAVEDPRRLIVPVLPLDDNGNSLDLDNLRFFDEYDAGKIMLLNKKLYDRIDEEIEDAATGIKYKTDNFHYELKKPVELPEEYEINGGL